MTLAEARALDAVVRLAGGPLPTADAVPGASAWGAKEAMTLLRQAGLARSASGRWVLTQAGRVAARTIGGH